MSKFSDTLGQFSDEFAEWFDDSVEVTNFEKGVVQVSPDAYDSPSEKQATAESPISTTANISTPAQSEMEAMYHPWGNDIDIEVEIFLDDSVTISDGEVTGLPYPSQVKHLSTGNVYVIQAIYDDGSGRLRCAGTLLPRRN